MKSSALVIAGAIALIGVMSAFHVVRPDPEYTYAASADGVVTVSGVSRAAQEVRLETSSMDAGSVFNGKAYTLTGEGMLAVPVTLTFSASDSLHVYFYNEHRGMWEMLDSDEVKNGIRTVEAVQFGKYALGTKDTVAIPVFVDEYIAVRKMAPADAVGYSIVAAYAREGEPLVRLLGQGEQGGCGGAVLPGEYKSESMRERRATVLVNDVQTTIDVVFLATWQVASGGCAQLSPFLPASEHATLPLSY